MKKVILIGSRNAEGKNDVRVLGSSFDPKKVSVSVINWEDLLFEISRGAQSVTDIPSGTDLKDCDLIVAANWYKTGGKVIYRDVAFALALYLKKHKIQFWNSEMGNQRSTTKLSALMQLALNGYDVPTTYFSLDADYLTSKADNFPMILKGAAASRGQDNFLVNNAQELAQHLQNIEVNHYLLEEYVPNESDLRVICIAGEPQLVIRRRRTNKTTHLNNTSRGASADMVPVGQLSAELQEACRNICKLMGREMAGIDILEANDGSSRQVFLEVNAIPQLTSGTFVDKKLTAISDSVINYLERRD